MDKIERAQKILIEQKQEHIRVINEEIADQILNIDFDQLKNLYCKVDEKIEYEDIEPIKATNPDRIPADKIKRYIELGEQKVKEEKFAVAIMAGGQGTRLRTLWTKRNF